MSPFSQAEWARHRAAKPSWRGSPRRSQRAISSAVLSSRSRSVGGTRMASWRAESTLASVNGSPIAVPWPARHRSGPGAGASPAPIGARRLRWPEAQRGTGCRTGRVWLMLLRAPPPLASTWPDQLTSPRWLAKAAATRVSLSPTRWASRPASSNDSRNRDRRFRGGRHRDGQGERARSRSSPTGWSSSKLNAWAYHRRASTGASCATARSPAARA